MTMPQPRPGAIYKLRHWPIFAEPKLRFILLLKEVDVYQFRAAIFTRDSQNRLLPDQFVPFSRAIYRTAYVGPRSPGILQKTCRLSFWDYVKGAPGAQTIDVNPVGNIITTSD